MVLPCHRDISGVLTTVRSQLKRNHLCCFPHFRNSAASISNLDVLGSC